MLKYILKRLLMAIPVLLGVTFIVFTIMSFTPGDPVQTMLGDNYTQEAYDEITEELGLNDPFLVRYVNYVVDLVQGDMGVSYSTKRAVSDEIFARFPATVRLAGRPSSWRWYLVSLWESYPPPSNTPSLIPAPCLWRWWVCPCPTSGWASCSFCFSRPIWAGSRPPVTRAFWP